MKGLSFLFSFSIFLRTYGHEDNHNIHNVLPDKDGLQHQKEHDHDPYVNVDGLNHDEQLMEYFRMFDLDGNGFVDGLESTKKMFMLHLENKDNLTSEELSSVFDPAGENFQMVEKIVDDQFGRADKNDDGYLSFSEFKSASAL